jgi:integrase
MKAPLTQKQVTALPLGAHSVGGVQGLYIRKREDGEQYYFRYKLDGQEKKIFYPKGTTLKQAREYAFCDRSAADRGEDPKQIRAEQEEQQKAEIARKKAAEIAASQTVKAISKEWIKEQSSVKRWANNATGQYHAELRLNKYIYPAIGDKNITAVTPQDLYNLLAPLWVEKSGTAEKVYTLLRNIFSWAIAKGCYNVATNPADKRGALGVLLKPLTKQRKSNGNMAALDFHEIPAFLSELFKLGSSSSLSVAFSILTAARFKAVRLATWEEIDLKARIWTIPESHDKSKGRRNRQIMLNKQAIQLLNLLPVKSGLLFPSRTEGKPLSENAPHQLIKGMDAEKTSEDGIGWKDLKQKDEKGNPERITQHGTARAGFRTWAKDDVLGNNKKLDQEAVEMCLLHSRKDSYNGAYDRATLAKERRQIMDKWGAFCCAGVSIKIDYSALSQE